MKTNDYIDFRELDRLKIERAQLLNMIGEIEKSLFGGDTCPEFRDERFNTLSELRRDYREVDEKIFLYERAGYSWIKRN